MKHPVIQFEIGGRDVQRSANFYSQLFGWHSDGGALDTGTREGIAGHLAVLGHEQSAYVTIYVEVEDVGAALARAEELGGKRRVGPAKIPTGVFAWFEDLDGNIIGLLHRKVVRRFEVRHTAISMITELALFDQSRLLKVITGQPPDSRSPVELSLELADRPPIVLRGEVKQLLPDGFLARVNLNTEERAAFDEALRWAAGAQREVRAEPRFPTVFPVSLTGDDPKVLKYVKNLSRKGAFIRTKKTPPVGSMVTVMLRLPDGGEPVEAEVRVVRAVSEEEAAKTGALEGVGVQFQTVTPDLRKRIDAFIEAIEGRAGKLAIVADDDVLIRTMVSQLLEAQGIRVEQASSGTEVLALIEKHVDQLTVVVMDLVMPGRDGLELVGEVTERLRPRSVPLVVITGGGPHVANQAIAKGARRAIIKGATPEGILASIESAMSGG